MIYYLLKYPSNLICNLFVMIINVFLWRDSKIVLIGSWMGEKFADNSRYLYQYLHENNEKLNIKKVVWVTRNKAQMTELKQLGYECVEMHSLKSYFYHLKAGVHIVCNVPHQTKQYKGDILGELSLGAKKIQLWHGIPLKGVGKSISVQQEGEQTTLRKISAKLKQNVIFRHFIHASGGWDNFYLLSTSKDVSERFIKIFDINREKIVQSSYPRNCECLNYLAEEQKAIERIQKSHFSILYAPTFRENSQSFTFPMDTPEIQNLIDKHNILWIQKPHSADKRFTNGTEKEKNQLVLNSVFDINTIIPYVDIIVTDYSSISFDGLYFDKKIIYYVPDFENYLKNERGFSANFDQNTAGDIVYSIADLKEKIDKFYLNKSFSEKEQRAIEAVNALVYDNKTASYEQIFYDLFEQ